MSRAEQLWNALTAAAHPEKSELGAAIRYVTRLLSGNRCYHAYLADVLNNQNRDATAASAFAPSFASIASAVRNFYGPGFGGDVHATRGGGFTSALTAMISATTPTIAGSSTQN